MNLRDEERDAWLAQALRHAPDADADAPPALSDVILREARAAAVQSAASAAPPRSGGIGLPRWLASAWDWLARPPVAAGFASVNSQVRKLAPCGAHVLRAFTTRSQVS